MHAILLALGLIAQEAESQPQTEPVEDIAENIVEDSAGEDASELVSHVALDMLAQLPPALDGWEPAGPSQRLIRTLAMAGREDLIVNFWPDVAFAGPACETLEDARLSVAVEAAREAQIVILNGGYWDPFQRFLAGDLGEALAENFGVFASQSFNYLRLEQPLPVGPVSPLHADPIYARMVQKLDEAGYRLVAFNARADQRAPAGSTPQERFAARVEAQVDNLIDAVLSEEPEARILIHVSGDHVLEVPQTSDDPDQPPLEGFASRFKQRTGIDPLTISLTHCELGQPRVDEDGFEIPHPGLLYLVNPAGFVPDGALDFVIVQPAPNFTSLQPGWRRDSGDVRVSIPDTLRPVDLPVMLEARAPGEPLEAMPIERLVVYPGDAHPLLLPPGAWVITAWTRDGAFGEPVALSVPSE